MNTEIEEKLAIIQQSLLKIEITGQNTLEECRKTNGRVTKLEDKHNEVAKDLAVFNGVINEKVKVLDKAIDALAPKVEKGVSFIDKIKGNWQSITIIMIIITYFLDKIMK